MVHAYYSELDAIYALISSQTNGSYFWDLLALVQSETLVNGTDCAAMEVEN